MKRNLYILLWRRKTEKEEVESNWRRKIAYWQRIQGYLFVIFLSFS